MKKAKPLPVECVVRGYLSGSGWKDYLQSKTYLRHQAPGRIKRILETFRTLCLHLPPKPRQAKHDMAITRKEMEDIIGSERTDKNH